MSGIYHQDAYSTFLLGDVREQLATLPDESVHTAITSPPYWGLRDYGTALWEGGDAECEHFKLAGGTGAQNLGKSPAASVANVERSSVPYRVLCGKCGATRIDDQLGLEATPELYVQHMVEVFREVRRVLRKDGTLWLNLGDSYSGSGGPGSQYDNKSAAGFKGEFQKYDNPNRAVTGLKPKDLVGIPWRVALALQADGWWLRSDIIWSKPNPMPESVTDRPTKSHEYVFLLTKHASYYYDADAIREPLSDISMSMIAYAQKNGERDDIRERPLHGTGGGDIKLQKAGGGARGNAMNPAGRNVRSVWEIATQPYAKAHFATFPEALPERCIKAGTSEQGCCPECGAPWERVVEKSEPRQHPAVWSSASPHQYNAETNGYTESLTLKKVRDITTTGWRPTCAHGAWVALEGNPLLPMLEWQPSAPIPATVLDPFLGSGTTAYVARKMGRKAIGIDLSAAYLDLAIERCRQGVLF